MATNLADEAAALAPQIVALRRDFHAHPELAFKETRTAGIRRGAARSAGPRGAAPALGQTGVVGLLRGARPGKTVALRADIDALPIEETNDVDYRSVNAGAMHA